MTGCSCCLYGSFIELLKISFSKNSMLAAFIDTICSRFWLSLTSMRALSVASCCRSSSASFLDALYVSVDTPVSMGAAASSCGACCCCEVSVSGIAAGALLGGTVWWVPKLVLCGVSGGGQRTGGFGEGGQGPNRSAVDVRDVAPAPPRLFAERQLVLRGHEPVLVPPGKPAVHAGAHTC